MTLTRVLKLTDGATLPRGATGTIDYLDAQTGSAEVLMDTRHRGLDDMDNHLWLEPFNTPEFTDGVRVSGKRWLPAISGRAAATLGVSLAVGVLAAVLHYYFDDTPDPDTMEAAANVFTRGFIVAICVAKTVMTV